MAPTFPLSLELYEASFIELFDQDQTRLRRLQPTRTGQGPVLIGSSQSDLRGGQTKRPAKLLRSVLIIVLALPAQSPP